MPLVFFYGTLLRNGANHHVLQRLRARFRGEARTANPRTLVDLGPYPALLSLSTPLPSSRHVYGELWEVDDEAMPDLDEFEGTPDLYRRDEIEVLTGEAKVAELVAFTYVLVGEAPAHAKVIESGRFMGRGVVLPNGASADQFTSAGSKKNG